MKILKLWPIFLLPVMAVPLNVDFWIIPNLRAQGVVGQKLFYIATILATVEMFYWYWFWGWVGREIANLKKIRETVEFGKEIANELKNDYYVNNKYLRRIINHVIKQYEWATDPNNWLVRLIKWGGHLSMIILGVEPVMAGGRTVGVIFCRTCSWKAGFITLSVANVGHIGIVIWGWDKFFSFFGW